MDLTRIYIVTTQRAFDYTPHLTMQSYSTVYPILFKHFLASGSCPILESPFK